MADTSLSSANGRITQSRAPRRIASLFLNAVCDSTTIGSAGKDLRAQRSTCKLSPPPSDNSRRSRSGIGPDWIRSKASHPLLAVSRCHALNSATDQRGRSREGSRVTTSRLATCAELCFTELTVIFEGRNVTVHEGSGWFDVVTLNAYCQRALNGIYRYDQCGFSLAR